MSTTHHASRTVGGSQEDQVGPDEETNSLGRRPDVTRRTRDALDTTSGDVADFPHAEQEFDGRAVFDLIHTANGDTFTCECGQTEGAAARFTFPRFGDVCESCLLACVNCEAATEANEAMMCRACRPAHELTEDGADRVCWGRKPLAKAEPRVRRTEEDDMQDRAEWLCELLGVEDEPWDPPPAKGGFAELVEREREEAS